ncbi:MAG: hypothetical protein JW791_00035 [Nanoarchaeota archaeon]|nr:hypothetical protein [Nanoarchaeota archaeon]
MMNKLRKDILENQRAFLATLSVVCTIIINLFYHVNYKVNPNSLVGIFPLLLWVAYDGNEHEKATVQGYWYWVIALIITSIILVAYPLF